MECCIKSSSNEVPTSFLEKVNRKNSESKENNCMDIIKDIESELYVTNKKMSELEAEKKKIDAQIDVLFEQRDWLENLIDKYKDGDEVEC